ncbi:MAG: Preprotein translocase subunit SecE [Clostridia bacterium]|jgi:preprotein translocase subunit SecE|uniref:preprotein translocase subunit SecE n=1 Tax=Petroclostridium xylanilyticum TaxID=1792311 RepID=UPI000B986BFF|nr:preprotein translocase subunit SecE [Petroclostridium xylanilyticum]MBZ4646690.1 Preprotein translocase subunit SecE [Clostridia bacterium]
MAEAAKQTKKNVSFSKVAKYFREVKAEMKKVVWPTWKQVRNNTIVVMISIIVVGIVIWTLDFIFGGALNYLIK